MVLGQDAKGNSTVKVNKLQNDLKLQTAQLEKIVTKKRMAEQEVASLTAKVKRLETEIADRKKAFSSKTTEYENEKATWENKYKLFNNELKKKDNVIKKYSEISGSSIKEGNVINGLEVIGDFTKHGAKFYGSSEVDSRLAALRRVHVLLPIEHSRAIRNSAQGERLDARAAHGDEPDDGRHREGAKGRHGEKAARYGDD